MFWIEIIINQRNMAMSLNRSQLIGNLTRDPEMKQIPGGRVVASFGIATNFNWKDQNGEKQSKAEFHNIVVWGKLAEICGQYLKKGAKIFIEGRLQTRDWEGEDGVKRYRTEIVADNMIMLDRKGDPVGGGMGMDRASAGIDNSSAGESSAPASSGEPVAEGASAGKDEDVKIDDLPF